MTSHALRVLTAVDFFAALDLMHEDAAVAWDRDACPAFVGETTVLIDDVTRVARVDLLTMMSWRAKHVGGLAQPQPPKIRPRDGTRLGAVYVIAAAGALPVYAAYLVNLSVPGALHVRWEATPGLMVQRAGHSFQPPARQ